MSTLLHRALPALSLALTVGLVGCLSPDDQENPELDTTELEVVSVSTPDYFRLERIKSGGASATNRYVIAPVNGGTMRCPTGARAPRCTVDDLVLPVDCDWECQDGVLSLRGVTVLRGELRTTRVTPGRRGRTALVAAAAFDTLDGSLGSKPVYRITQRVAPCLVAPCPVFTTATRVNSPNPAVQLATVDFSGAHDPNYVLDAARGLAQMARAEGLLATGTISRGTFRVDRVFRQWSPIADCDVLAAARAHAFPEAPAADEVQLVFATTAEAETYQDADGRRVSWLVRTENSTATVAFTAGFNDLWSQTFTVGTSVCDVTITGEH